MFDMTIASFREFSMEFKCWHDLSITTLREFFEIFITSAKEGNDFYMEILSSKYDQISISVT